MSDFLAVVGTAGSGIDALFRFARIIRVHDSGLPLWATVLCVVAGLWIASLLITWVPRLFRWREYRRDRRLCQCYLAVERAWSRGNAAGWAPYVSPALAAVLPERRAAVDAEPVVHHREDVRLAQLKVIAGGGKDDRDCVAWVSYSMRYWTTDRATGAALEGNRLEQTPGSTHWRFVHDPQRGWLADEISVAPPE